MGHGNFRPCPDEPGRCANCGRLRGWHAGTSCYAPDATGLECAPPLTPPHDWGPWHELLDDAGERYWARVCRACDKVEQVQQLRLVHA
jgi:hypothetical protein